jgi:hypothetical protein
VSDIQTDASEQRFASRSGTYFSSPRAIAPRTKEIRSSLEWPFLERAIRCGAATDALGPSAAPIAARDHLVSRLGMRALGPGHRAAMQRMTDSPLLSLLFFSTLIAMTFLI